MLSELQVNPDVGTLMHPRNIMLLSYCSQTQITCYKCESYYDIYTHTHTHKRHHLSNKERVDIKEI